MADWSIFIKKECMQMRILDGTAKSFILHVETLNDSKQWLKGQLYLSSVN